MQTAPSLPSLATFLGNKDPKSAEVNSPMHHNQLPMDTSSTDRVQSTSVIPESTGV